MTVVHHNAVQQSWVICYDAIYPEGDKFFQRRLAIHGLGHHSIEVSIVTRRHDLRDFAAEIYPLAHTASHANMAHTELLGNIAHARELKVSMES